MLTIFTEKLARHWPSSRLWPDLSQEGTDHPHRILQGLGLPHLEAPPREQRRPELRRQRLSAMGSTLDAAGLFRLLVAAVTEGIVHGLDRVVLQGPCDGQGVVLLSRHKHLRHAAGVRHVRLLEARTGM